MLEINVEVVRDAELLETSEYISTTPAKGFFFNNHLPHMHASWTWMCFGGTYKAKGTQNGGHTLTHASFKQQVP